MAPKARFESATTRQERLDAVAADDKQTSERERLVLLEQQKVALEARLAEANTAVETARREQQEKRDARAREYAESVVARYDSDRAATQEAVSRARRELVRAATTDGGDTVAAYRALTRAIHDDFAVQGRMANALGTLGRQLHEGRAFSPTAMHLARFSEAVDAALGAYGSGYGADAEELEAATRQSYIEGGE